MVKALKEKSLHPDLFIWVTNADHFYTMHLKNGADIIEEISDRPWGSRQYVVRDLNGYNLKFAQPI
jgi:PhnB protein